MNPIVISTPELILDAKCSLGEGPVWNSESDELLWVDILKNTLYRWNHPSKKPTLIKFADKIGCFGLTTKNNIIAGVKDAIGLYNPAEDEFTTIFNLHPLLPNIRFNDGKCTPEGRFIAGTMDMDEKEPNGAVYVIDADLSVRKVISDVTISNGITWNPDKSKMYYIDTPTLIVKVFDYDSQTGTIGHPRDLIKIPEGVGYPDGMNSDQEGRLYIAMWGGHAISIWDGLNGKSLGRIEVPALNPTSCTFGGKALDELFITSARVGMHPDQLKKYPLSGGIFKVKINTKGLENYRFIER